MKTATGLYRTKKYGKWIPFKILIPNDISDKKRLNTFVEEQLGAVEIQDLKVF